MSKGLTFDASHLSNALKLVKKVSSFVYDMPNILIYYKEKAPYIELICVIEDTAIISKIPVENPMSKGFLIMPNTSILPLVIGKSKVTISVDEKTNTLKFKAGRRKGEIFLQQNDNYDENFVKAVKSISNVETTFSLPEEAIKFMKGIKVKISDVFGMKEDIGVVISINEDGLELSSTDKYHGYFIKNPDIKLKEANEINVPVNYLLFDYLKNFTISISDSSYIIKDKYTLIKLPLLQPNNYHKHLKNFALEGFDKYIKVNLKELSDTLSDLKTIYEEGAHTQFKIKDDKLLIQQKSSMGKVANVLKIDNVTKKSFGFNLDATMFSDTLSLIKGKEVYLGVNAKETFALVRPADNENMSYFCNVYEEED